MKTFDLNRFGKTFRWIFAVRLQWLIGWTAGYAVIVFLGELLWWFFNKGSETSLIVTNVAGFFMIFIYIALGIGLTMLFYDENKKQKREALLMLPASNLEKYLSAFIYYTVIWGAAVFVSFICGDTLRMIVRALFWGDEWISAIPQVLDNMSPKMVSGGVVATTEFYVMTILLYVSFLVWLNSLYILGGTLLRKFSFVITSIVFLLSVALLGWVLNHTEMTMFNYEWTGQYYAAKEVGAIPYILCVLLPLLSVFNYWASFQIFKGFQLITNKWTNYDILKR